MEEEVRLASASSGLGGWTPGPIQSPPELPTSGTPPKPHNRLSHVSWVSTAEIIPAAEPEEGNGVWPPPKAEQPAAQQVRQLPGGAIEPGVQLIAQSSPSFGKNAVRAANALAVAGKEVDPFLEADSPEALPPSGEMLQAPQMLATQETADSRGSDVRPLEAAAAGGAPVQLGHVAEVLGGVQEAPQRRSRPADQSLRTPRTPANSERTDSSTDQPPASGRSGKLLPAPAAPQLIRRNSDPSAAAPMPAQQAVGTAAPRVAASRAVSFSQRTPPPAGKRSFQPTGPLAAGQGQVRVKAAQGLQATGAASEATPHPELYPLMQRASGGPETAGDHKLLQRLPSVSEPASKQPVVQGSRAATADMALHPASQVPNSVTAEPEIHALDAQSPMAAAAGTAPTKASEPATEPSDELAKKSQAPTVRNRAATADVIVQSAPNHQTISAGTAHAAVQPAREQPIVLQPTGGAIAVAAAAVGHLPVAAGAAAAPVLQAVAHGQGVQPAAESANKQNGPIGNRATTAGMTLQPALKSGRGRAATADIAVQPAFKQPRLPHPSRATAAVPSCPLPTAAAAAAGKVMPKKAHGPGAPPTNPTSKQNPPTSRSRNRAATADVFILPAGDVQRGRAATAKFAIKPAQEQLTEPQPKGGASALAAGAPNPAQPPPVSQKPAGVLDSLESAVVEVAESGEARTVEADAMKIVESGAEHLAEAAVAKIAGKAVEKALQAQLAQWSSATTAGVTTLPVESTQSESRRQRTATTEIATQPVPLQTKSQRRRTLEPAPQMFASTSLQPALDELPAASEAPAAGKEPTAQSACKPAQSFNRSRSAAARSAVKPVQQQQTPRQKAATADAGYAPAQPSHLRFSPGSRTVSAIQESEDPAAPGSATYKADSPHQEVLSADTSMQQPGDLSSLAEPAPEDGPQAWGQDQSEVLSEVESSQGGPTDANQPHAEPPYDEAYSLQGSVTDELDASERNNRSDNNQSTVESVSQQDSDRVGGRRNHSRSLPGSRPGSAPRGASKRPHELYAQTLQEAHSQPLQRPRSAQQHRREKLQEELQAQLLVPASQWSVAQVSSWVSALGLPQYCKRFIHQGVNGSLLLRLDHRTLKADLGIAVLGHREVLLAAICGLPATFSAAANSQLWEPSVLEASPESPVLKAKLHRRKLLREMEQAEAHAASCHRKAEGTSHQAELAEDDVLHIRGAILALEHQFNLQRSLASASLAFSPKDGSPGVDTRGIIPWHPNGAPFELTIARIERAQADTQASSPKRGGPPVLQLEGAKGPSFLDRMTYNLREREARLKETRHKLHSPESRFQDPNYSAKRRKADLAAVEAHVSRSLGVRLSDLTSGAVTLTSLKPAGPPPAASALPGNGPRQQQDMQQESPAPPDQGSAAMEQQQIPKPAAETEPVRDTAPDTLNGPPESPAATLRLQEPEAAQAGSRGAATETATERLPAGFQSDTASTIDAQPSEFAAAEQPSSLTDLPELAPIAELAPSMQETHESAAAAKGGGPPTAALDVPPLTTSQPFVSSAAEAPSSPAEPPGPGSDPHAQGDQSVRRQGSAEQPGRLSRLSLQGTGENASAALILGADQTGGKQPPSLAAVIDFLALQMSGRVGLSTLQASAVLRLHGEDRKLQRLAAASKESTFLERYNHDEQTRPQRQALLRQQWHDIETQPPKPPKGRQARYWKPPVTQTQRETADLESCRLLFAQAGWPAADFVANEGKGAEAKLNAVLLRAEAIGTGAQLKQSQGRSHSLADYEDDLDEVQATFLETQAAAELEAAEAAAEAELAVATGHGEPDAKLELRARLTMSSTAQVTLSRGSTGRSDALKAALLRTASASSSAHLSEDPSIALQSRMGATLRGMSATAKRREADTSKAEGDRIAARTQQALSQTLPKGAATEGVLGNVVKQLSLCRADELAKLKALTGPKKQLAVYRTLLTRRFLQGVEQDSQQRTEKMDAVLKALRPKRRKLTKEEADLFYARLQTDSERRNRSRAEAVQAARDQEAASMEQARKVLAETLTRTRPKSAGRPGSASAQPASGAPSLSRAPRPGSARPA